MDIKQLKKELGIDNKKIAEFFGYSTVHSYQNSKLSKERTEKGIVSLYALFKKSVGIKNMVDPAPIKNENAQP